MVTHNGCTPYRQPRRSNLDITTQFSILNHLLCTFHTYASNNHQWQKYKKLFQFISYIGKRLLLTHELRLCASNAPLAFGTTAEQNNVIRCWSDSALHSHKWHYTLYRGSIVQQCLKIWNVDQNLIRVWKNYNFFQLYKWRSSIC